MARRTLKKKTPQIGGQNPPRPIPDKHGGPPTCPTGYTIDDVFSMYDKINPRYSCKPLLSTELGIAARAMNQLMTPAGASGLPGGVPGGLPGGVVGSALGRLSADGGTSGMTTGVRLIGGHHQQSRSRRRRRHRRLRRIQSWKYRSTPTPTPTTRHRRRHRV